MNLRILCLAAFAGLSACATQGEVARIRVLEDQLSAALLTRDVKALDRLWGEDLIFIARNGEQSTKAQRLAGQARAGEAAPGESNVNDTVRVSVRGGSAATVVTSTWTTRARPTRYRALHVWRREEGAWRLFAAQVASLD